MRIIITGGTGLVGTALAVDLLKDGHEVILLSRDPDRHAQKSPQGARVVKWDARSAEGWGHLAEGADAIINLAGANIGEGRWTAERKKIIVESRENAGKAVTQAVAGAKQKPGLVVQSSGVDFYGVHGEEKITESDHAGEGFLSQVTRAWEESTRPVEDYSVRRVVYRGAVVLAMQGGALPRILLPFRLFAGGPLGSGRQWFSWVHIKDQVAALRFFIEHPETTGVYNVSAPNPVQNKELARAIGKVMHRPGFIPVPAFVIRLLFGEMSVTVLGGQRVLPDRLQKASFSFDFQTIEQALQDLLA
ncbi:MAG: TIGR01777 family oxidoreductase [Anaerolineales bacterium]|nr:TIGR01777 family oxidoreductase [Anaerolineales bacterium]